MSASHRLEFVVAGDNREMVEKTCGKDAWRTLADNGFVERLTVSCVGFRRNIETNSLLVVLPKAFNSSASRVRLQDRAYQRDQVYRLIRVFRKIRRETLFTLDVGPSNEILQRESHPIDPVLDSFDAALRLRQDYRENGAYTRKSPRPIKNAPNLPVNWPRTFRRTTALLNGGEIFLSDTVHQARKRDFGHPLCLLHTSCLKEIFSLTGERSDLDDVEGLDYKAYKTAKAHPREFLRGLRGSIFDERGRFLISAIASFLGESSLIASSRESREELLSYSKDFEDIWEQVLRDLISPGLKNRTLPSGEWYAWPNTSIGKGMQPEFDIRLASDNSEVLIDAKDYRLLNGTKWFGSTSDHYKQVIYRQLLMAPKTSTVVNIIAFPSLGQKKLFAIRGCHHWKEIPGSRVFEITVDFDLAIKRWLREISIDINREMSDLLAELNVFALKLDSSGTQIQP
jgi:hypothetical protein